MKKVVCYFTGGWTEAGAMSIFLKKMNNRFNYFQRCPNKPKYKAGLKRELCGLTGNALIDYICNDIQSYPDEVLSSVAIIIEDDLDGRFGNSMEKFVEYRTLVANRIYRILGKELPVIFFAASPEIESWLICDWNNSFGSIYGKAQGGPLLENVNRYFGTSFKRYLDSNVLKQYCNAMEDYGFFDGTYIKLSNALIDALKIGYRDSLNKDSEFFVTLACNKNIDYSKRIHGDMMLRNIVPENIESRCNKYFRQAFYHLRALE